MQAGQFSRSRRYHRVWPAPPSCLGESESPNIPAGELLRHGYAQISADRAEFRPQRLFAFELRRTIMPFIDALHADDL
jgi:hypothetical protein